MGITTAPHGEDVSPCERHGEIKIMFMSAANTKRCEVLDVMHRRPNGDRSEAEIGDVFVLCFAKEEAHSWRRGSDNVAKVAKNWMRVMCGKYHVLEPHRRNQVVQAHIPS